MLLDRAALLHLPLRDFWWRVRINVWKRIEKREEFLNTDVGAGPLLFIHHRQMLLLPHLKPICCFLLAELHLLLMVELVEPIAGSAA